MLKIVTTTFVRVTQSIAALVLLSSTLQAASFDLDALMEKASINAVLETLGDNMKQGIDQQIQQGKPTQETALALKLYPLIDEAYAPKRLKSLFRDAIANRISSEDGAAIMAFLDSPLGKRTSAAERTLTNYNTMLEIQTNLGKLLKAIDKTPKRKALYITFIEATHQKEAAADIMISTMLGMRGALAQLNPSSQSSLIELRKALKQQRGAIINSLNSSILAMTVHAYKDLSDDEFNNYLDFVRSPVSKRFIEISNKASIEVLGKAASDLELLAKKMKNKG